MSLLVEKILEIYGALIDIFSHLWIYILLWLTQFIVMWVYVQYQNKPKIGDRPKLGDVGGILLKFRIIFLLAVLLGYFVGRG
ncbi:MAG: hypothetical protein HOG49_14640 [Candidatus Scalindua sp.]|jgi:hypothetical protein|nr:hypothetical protein [Candidatus Scalindua sp.]